MTTRETSLLGRIESPRDLKDLSVESLEVLADELRDLIIKTVSQRGGHLASSLGVVELTLAHAQGIFTAR